MAIKGGCLCGAVTYEISGEPMFVGHCACENCQKSTGGGHSSIAAFPEAQVSVHGARTTFAAKGDSGQPTTYEFCPKCGSRLFTRAAMMPGVVMVTLGTMEAGAALEPSMLIYGKHRRAWDHVPPGLAVFEAMPAGPPN
ncbi:MAG TPA: GFA family protein [Caulobacteraceae bacterium]|nr:GFA family protein [Caulobacteraceae bacterium]